MGIWEFRAVILRGAEVLGFVGCKALEERDSKNKGKYSVVHLACSMRQTWLQRISDTRQLTAASAMAALLSTSYITGTIDRTRWEKGELLQPWDWSFPQNPEH
jgi:hypothetical protein